MPVTFQAQSKDDDRPTILDALSVARAKAHPVSDIVDALAITWSLSPLDYWRFQPRLP